MEMFSKVPPKREELKELINNADPKAEVDTEEIEMESAVDDVLYYADDLPVETIDMLISALQTAKENKTDSQED